MKILSIIFLFFSLAAGFLYGCAPPTAAVIREIGSERQVIFEADEDYQIVYNKILDQTQKCFNTYRLTAQMLADGSLSQETKTGSITVAFHGILAVDTYQIIDIYAINDNSCVIIAYYSLGSVDKYGKALKEWVLDNSTECEPKKK